MQRWKNTTVDKLSIKQFLNNAGTYTVLILAVGGLAFFGIFQPQGDQGGLTGMAAEVGSIDITSNDFRTAYQNTYQTYQNQYGQDFDPIKFSLSEIVLNQLVNKSVLFLTARSLGVQASEEDVIAYLTEIDAFRDKEGKFSEQLYNSFLRSNRYSEEVFMTSMVRDLTLGKLRKFVGSFVFVSQGEAKLDYRLENTWLDIELIKIEKSKLQLTIPAAEIDTWLTAEAGQAAARTYYDTHQDEFKRPEQVHARHILIAHAGARNVSGEADKRSLAEAQTLAHKVQVLAIKGDFKELVVKYTDEPQGRERHGDLGFFTKDEVAPELSAAAFALQAGQTSEVVKTAFGFHIVNVIARKEKIEKTFADAQREIGKKLLKKEKAPQFAQNLAQDLLQQLNAKTDVEAILTKHKLKKETTGKFSLATRYIPQLGAKKELRAQIYALTTDNYVLHESEGDYYLLRLKNKTTADLKKFKHTDRGNEEYLRFYRSNDLYTYLEKSSRKKLEARNKIWLNEKFLYFDRLRATVQEQPDS